MAADPGGNPSFTGALIRFAQMRSMAMAEHRSRLMAKLMTDYLIDLGLASNAEEAGEVRIEDVLQAERERAGS